MLVPVIAGSDKTTVSVATGHQEYHPVYASSGIISNTAHRGHGNSVVPFAFLPIPKGMPCVYSTISDHVNFGIFQQANLSKRSLHTRSSAANSIISVLNLHLCHWSHTWNHQRCSSVQMVISAVQSSALDHTLPTIRNKSGFRELYRTGAQSMYLMLSTNWFVLLHFLQCYFAGVMPNRMILTLLVLIDALMRRQIILSKSLTLVYYGTNMEFELILWFVKFPLVTSSFWPWPVAIHPWISTCRYSWTVVTWSPASAHQRCLQGPPCDMGQWIFTPHLWWNTGTGDNWGHWSSASKQSHCGMFDYLLSNIVYQQSLRFLAFIDSQMARTSHSGLVMIRRH